MLGMNPISGVKRQINNQSTVVIDLVTHNVVASVQRQLVVEERFRYIQVTTQHDVFKVLIRHHGIISFK